MNVVTELTVLEAADIWGGDIIYYWHKTNENVGEIVYIRV
jgi:hypothetical protein